MSRTSLAALSVLAASALASCGDSTGRADAATGLDAASPDAAEVSMSPDAAFGVDGGARDRDAGPLDVDRGAPSTTYPAFTVDWPQLEGSVEGVLTAPRFVAVTYDGDPLRADIERFVDALGGSRYWAATTSEYGVGRASSLAPVHLPAPAPALLDDLDVRAALLGALDGTHAEWPAPDGQTVYLLFYPADTTITLGREQSCMVFAGYHSVVRPRGVVAPYAVVPRCGARGTAARSTILDELTAVTSHEVVEVATDFDPGHAPGYLFPDARHAAFATFGGSETADMCALTDASYVVDPELAATVQRSWSNAAARAGEDPCVPSDGSPFFLAVPVGLDAAVPLELGPMTVTTPGIVLTRDASRTIELDLVSGGDTGGPFEVRAIDRRTFFGQSPALTFDLDRSGGQNGEKLYLTITRVGSDPLFPAAIPYAIVARLGTRRGLWFGVVGAP